MIDPEEIDDLKSDRRRVSPEVISLQFQNIQQALKGLKEGDIKEIKADIKEIKENSPSRREFDDLKAEVKELKESQTWLFRTVIGSIITMVMTGGILAFVLLK